MNGYKCFYRDKTCDVYAPTSYAAQEKAARVFKAKKRYEVTVMLCEKQSEGGVPVQVTHVPTM